MKPQYIVPLVAYLCHESADVNGAVFEVGAGGCEREGEAVIERGRYDWLQREDGKEQE